METAGILSLIGGLGEGVLGLFTAKQNVKLENISIEKLKEELKIAQQNEDLEKIKLAEKALELKQAEEKGKTTQTVTLIVVGSTLIGFLAWLIFGKSPKKTNKKR